MGGQGKAELVILLAMCLRLRRSVLRNGSAFPGGHCPISDFLRGCASPVEAQPQPLEHELSRTRKGEAFPQDGAAEPISRARSVRPRTSRLCVFLYLVNLYLLIHLYEPNARRNRGVSTPGALRYFSGLRTSVCSVYGTISTGPSSPQTSILARIRCDGPTARALASVFVTRIFS